MGNRGFPWFFGKNLLEWFYIGNIHIIRIIINVSLFSCRIKRGIMIPIIIFEFFLLILYAAGIVYISFWNNTFILHSMKVPILTALIGGIGGITYCLRAIYINASVNKSWDNEWRPWYYIRPFVSSICGIISWIFLKAGLLVLEAKENPNATLFAFYAIAFIAGLNVDKFILKLEDIGQTVWGIEKSRLSKSSEEKKNG